ncbi:MAG: excinuclease ABC subunit UvrC [Cyclobacteriaceae bacterium]
MLKQRLSNTEYNQLPHEPGIYKFLNAAGTIIYVGKAKDLIKRVSSYFTKAAQHNRKTVKLVSEIHQIEFIIVNSEFDALLLENNLIKQNQPKYNILLKDDKSFPSICITKERFPRIYSTRRIDKSQGEFFGPYTSVKAMNGVLDLIRKLYKIRTCNFNLSRQNVESKKYKICLEYHIGNCLGPCEGLQDEQDYQHEISHAREILVGKISKVLQQYKSLMSDASSQLNFELAQNYKEKINLLAKFQTKSLIVNPKLEAADVIAIISDDEHFYLNYMQVVEGAIKVSETLDFKKTVEAPSHELLQPILFTLRNKYQSNSSEVLSNKEIDMWDELELTIPKIGDKKKLIDLALKNALFFKNERLRKKEEARNKPKRVLEQLKTDLSLKELPVHIECFDNSNIQGTHPVASMVCFKNAKPSKRDYRKFNIKTVVGPDDFSSMKEIVGRRYGRLKSEKLPFPNLVVIDGGKGQLHAATDALKELDLYGQIPIIGIAKRLEEIYYPEDSFPLHISKKSTSLKILQHLRDEAHRFAINFHRDKRSKAFTVSELDKIPGIGTETRKALIKQFKSTKRISELPKQDLEKVIGQSKASRIVDYFKQKKEGQ